MINVGMIGCGRIADLHYQGYVNNPDARLAAVCDSNPEAAARRQREWGTPKRYIDYRDLLADKDIDAVEVLTPQTIHEPVVIDAARAGKHIACQKPMTVSLDAADRMIAETAQAGITYKVTDNYLFYPPIALAKRMIEDGLIGEPITMRMKFVGGLWCGGWEVPIEW